MTLHREITPSVLHHAIRKGDIRFAGNIQLKIFGLLRCKSGKRMKLTNRVFFNSAAEALKSGFRPCSHCLHEKYLRWKIRKKQVEKKRP